MTQSDDGEAPAVARELADGVALLTMQMAPHNLLGTHLLDTLLSSLGWAVEHGARAVVLRSGLRHFSAGADLEVFRSAVDRGEVPELPLLEVLKAFDSLPIPILASVHGVCVGGGFELALASDMIVAAETAVIGCVESSIGLHPLMGAVQRITERAGATRAKEMAMLGRRYDARTLESWGVINWVVPEDELGTTTMSVARELAQGPTVAHAATKELVSVAVQNGVRVADLAMGKLQIPIWRSEDLKVGLASFKADGPGKAQFAGQ